MSVYIVTGRNPYRGHTTNTTFEATLDHAVEERAVRRRTIAVVDASTSSLKAGSYTLPRAQDPTGETTERKEEA